MILPAIEAVATSYAAKNLKKFNLNIVNNLKKRPNRKTKNGDGGRAQLDKITKLFIST